MTLPFPGGFEERARLRRAWRKLYLAERGCQHGKPEDLDRYLALVREAESELQLLTERTPSCASGCRSSRSSPF